MNSKSKLLALLCLGLLISISVKSIDNRNEKFRGFMIDAPRGVETMNYYFQLIDFLHEKNFNSIIFRLTDDQGSAYQFSSHPELNMCEGAFTALELTELVKYAQKKGIEIIPEIESFGHSKYITQTQRYKFLNDGPAEADFNALCPVNDSTIALMKDLFTEVAAIFPSEYLHIGCDEVNWGASEMSKTALITKSKHQIWAEYVNKLNECIKGIGKTTMIWGDVPIYQEIDVLELLNKDIVIIDWNYWENDKEKVESIARTVLKNGFRVVGCPAVNWCRWGPRINKSQFDNISAYAAVYENSDDPDNLGIIISNWVPKRYLQNSQWDSYTIATEVVKNKGNFNYLDALPAFVKNYYGAQWDTIWENIYTTLYEKAPQWACGQNDSLKFNCWFSEQQIREIVMKNKPLENPFIEIAKLMKSYQNRVTKNREGFDDLLLTTEFIAYNYHRQNELLAFANSNKSDLKSTVTYIRRIALEDQNFLSKINLAWGKGRRGNADEMDKGYMWSFGKAANYSKYLKENPAELLKILEGKN